MTAPKPTYEHPEAHANRGESKASDAGEPTRHKKSGLSKRLRMLNSSAFKRQTFYALENLRQGNIAAKLVGSFLFFLIVLNALLVFFSAQPGLDPIATNLLGAFFIFSTVCFCIEYIARIWIADLAYGNCTRAQARLKYIISPMGFVDLLSFAPSMISWFMPVTSALIHAVGVLRLIRLIKVTRYMRGFRTIGRVFRKHYQEIVASLLVICLLIVVASVIMYEVESPVQPDKFTNLFQGIWFAVETVTSVGYGDIVPVTVPGKICGMIIMMLSLGLIAIPGGIFSAGFVAEFQNANLRKIERDVERNSGRRKDEAHDDHGESHRSREGEDENAAEEHAGQGGSHSDKARS